jgi:hypothetical protein
MGRAVELKPGAVALDDPFGAACSDVLDVAIFGMEFVVEARGSTPGWNEEPEGRAALVGPPLFEGLAELMAGS